MTDWRTVRRVELSALGTLTELSAGAQGQVFRPQHQPLDDPSPCVVKTYLPQVAAEVSVPVLATMVARAGTLVLRGCPLSGRLAWPAALVIDADQPVGFLMLEASGEFRVSLRLRNDTRNVLAEVQHLLNPDHMLAERGLPIHDQWRLQFLQATAETIGALHAMHIAVGDISPKNTLFSLTGKGCFLLDCDTMTVDGQAVLSPVDTPDWNVPTAEPRSTVATDRYKFGLLAIRLFAGDQIDRDPAALAARAPELGRLARQAMGDEPNGRPAMAEWSQAIARAIPTASAAPPRLRMTVPTMARPTRTPRRQAAAPQPQPASAFPPIRSRRRWPAIAGLVGLIVLGLCLGPSVLRAFGGSAASQGQAVGSSGDSANQASQVEDLLSASGRSRVNLGGALNSVMGCADLPDAMTTLAGVATDRQNELQNAQLLTVSALPNGDALKSRLIDALQHSLNADQAYAGWARAVQADNCSGDSMSDDDHQQGDAESALATVAKHDFIQLWSGIATSYGYPVPAETDI
jgi:hypothetical protein